MRVFTSLSKPRFGTALLVAGLALFTASAPTSAVDCTQLVKEAACKEYSEPPKAPIIRRDGAWYKCVWRPATADCREDPTVVYLLERGDRGEYVEILQKLLGEKNFSVTVTGEFDLMTYNAVKEFQKSHGLTPDGLVGKQTFEAFQKEALAK